MGPESDEELFPLVFDVLREHGYRPGLHLLGDRGRPRAWLSGAGFGALGRSIEDAARLYVEAGATLARDPALRSSLRHLAGEAVRSR